MWLVYCVSTLTGVQVCVIVQWYRLLLILWWDGPHSGMTVSKFCYLLGVFPVSRTHVEQVHGHSLRKDVRIFPQPIGTRFWKKSFFGRWNQLVFVALLYNHLWHDLTFLPNNLNSWGPIYLFKRFIDIQTGRSPNELLITLDFLVKIVVNVNFIGLDFRFFLLNLLNILANLGIELNLWL